MELERAGYVSMTIGQAVGVSASPTQAEAAEPCSSQLPSPHTDEMLCAPAMPLLCIAQLAFILTSVLMGSFAVLTSYANRSPLVRNRASRLRVVEKGGLDTGQQTRAEGKCIWNAAGTARGRGVAQGSPSLGSRDGSCTNIAGPMTAGAIWCGQEVSGQTARPVHHPPVRLYSTPLLTRTDALCPTAL